MLYRAPLLLLAGSLTVLGGCVYFNGLYNAERLFGEAERMRRLGQEQEATERYATVVEKASRSYRREDDGKWADDALYLVGRAYMRQGDYLRARAALERTVLITDSEEIRAGATLYLGAVAAFAGNPTQGIALLNQALRTLEPGRLRGEGHLWRARVLLSLGQVDAGWWDLDRAGEEDATLVTAAELERLVWGVAHGDSARAGHGVRGLLSSAEGAGRVDTLHALVEDAGEAWGPGTAASLLAGAEDAPWPNEARDRTLLLRASLRLQAGDSAAAAADAEAVASGVGPMATRARLWLAGVVLERARRIEDLDRARPVLLPAVGHPRVLEVLETIRKLELLDARAAEDGVAVALFAAGELARDELGAPHLARNLFLRYAGGADDPTWAGKALLAALTLSRDDAEREMLLDRIRARPSDPYLRAAVDGHVQSAEYERLELELQYALSAVVAEVTAAAGELDVLVRERSDTVGGERR